MSAGRRGPPEPNFFAARFSLRRCLSVFCGFCFNCFFGLSELLLITTSGLPNVCSRQRELALQSNPVRLGSYVSRAVARWEVAGFRPGFWQQGQSHESTPVSRRIRPSVPGLVGCEDSRAATIGSFLASLSALTSRPLRRGRRKRGAHAGHAQLVREVPEVAGSTRQEAGQRAIRRRGLGPMRRA